MNKIITIPGWLWDVFAFTGILTWGLLIIVGIGLLLKASKKQSVIDESDPEMEVDSNGKS